MTSHEAILAACLFAMTSACTYGRVTWDDDPVAGAAVTVENCDGKTWTAATNPDGYYALDGNSNPSQAVDEGLILLTVAVGSAIRRDLHINDYGPCPNDPELLCDRHDMDFGFKPQTPFEWAAWHTANNAHNINAQADFNGFCGP